MKKLLFTCCLLVAFLAIAVVTLLQASAKNGEALSESIKAIVPGITFQKIRLGPTSIELLGVNINYSTPLTAQKISIDYLPDITKLTPRWTIEVHQPVMNIGAKMLLTNKNIENNTGGSQKSPFIKNIAKIRIREGTFKVSIGREISPIKIRANLEWDNHSKYIEGMLQSVTWNHTQLSNLTIKAFKNQAQWTAWLSEASQDSPSQLQLKSKISTSSSYTTLKIRGSLLLDALVAAGISEVVKPKSLAGAIETKVSNGILTAKVSFGSPDIQLSHPAIAPSILEPLKAFATGKVTLDLTTKDIKIDKGILSLKRRNSRQKPIKVGFKLTKTMAGDFTTALHMKPTSCNQIINAIPRELIPIAKDFKIQGNMEGYGTIKIPKNDPFNFDLNVEPYFNCSIKSLTNRYTPIKKINEKYQSNSSYYTPLSEISPIMLKSIVALEDGFFWKHKGIRLNAILGALKENFKKGRIKIGGSTITMQTAKNLYLTHDRTLARKAQELLITWHLEQTLTKKEILETYLNIIEFGPNIFGIKEASRIHFNKEPKNLNLIESIYLASVLPSPVKRFRNFCRGRLSYRYSNYLNRRLNQLESLNRIDSIERAQAKSQKLVFASGDQIPHCASLAQTKQKATW